VLWQNPTVRRANVLTGEFSLDGDEPEGYRAEWMRVSPLVGANALAVKVIELPPGQSVCPYHYEYEEEWLLVLEGAVSVRTPEGVDKLDRGDIVSFPPGPDGAHKVTNAAEGTSRVIMFSSAREPCVAVYPDSDKVGVFKQDEDFMLHRRDGRVDYWEGER
jgi:uncharacterized cupin superfamily protein